MNEPTSINSNETMLCNGRKASFPSSSSPIGTKYIMSSRSRLSFDYDRFKENSTPLATSPPRFDRENQDSPAKMNSASQVLNIPELLELILLSLPGNTTYEEISSSRTILLACTTTRTWYSLIQTSPPIRRRLYLPTCDNSSISDPWYEQSAFPPAQPNPWMPLLLLNQRSWGSSYPFDNSYSAFNLVPSQPKLWTFSFEMSRAQYSRLPPPGAWRNMLAALPPFTDIWYTRCFYELGSGRAPFVTHWDYDAKKPKSQQQYRVHSDQGITLGMIADAMSEMFEKHSNARFVLVESLRIGSKAADDRPITKSHLPGSSAEEREYEWY